MRQKNSVNAGKTEIVPPTKPEKVFPLFLRGNSQCLVVRSIVGVMVSVFVVLLFVELFVGVSMVFVELFVEVSVVFVELCVEFS